MTTERVHLGPERTLTKKEWEALQIDYELRSTQPETAVTIDHGDNVTETDSSKGWQDLANCIGVDPELFFPERGASTREAKEVCKGCVVREECLEYAIDLGEKFGIWGGLSERQRRRIRRQRSLARRALAEQASLAD